MYIYLLVFIKFHLKTKKINKRIGLYDFDNNINMFITMATLNEFTKLNNVLMIFYKALYHHPIMGLRSSFVKSSF